MSQRFVTMAVFADYESLNSELAKCEDNFYKPFSMSELSGYLTSHYGMVASIRAYADWRNPALRKRSQELARCNARMTNVIGGKSDAIAQISSNIIVDALECLALNPAIDCYVFVSSDVALLPLVAKIHAAAKRVIVVNVEGFINGSLVRSGDDFVCICDKGYSQRSPENMDRGNIISAIKAMLTPEGMPLSEVEKQLAEEMPDLNLADYGCNNLQEFIQNVANHAMRVVENAKGVMVMLGSGRNASAYSDDELAKFSLEEYMRATRWYIEDGDIRDRVLHNIYILFKENGRTLSNEELRNLVDPDRIVEDKPWHGTIFSLVYGACLWENPDSSGQHLPNRRLSLFRTVKSEDEFLIRYYVSLFHKAYTDRPGLTPHDCAELMHPGAVEEHLPIYEQVFEELAKRK